MVEQEIDLSLYFRALTRYWWLVLLLTLLGGGLAYLATAQTAEDNYRATALVAVTEPRQLVEFDIRFEDVAPRGQLIRVLPELATSDDVIQKLFETLPEGHFSNRLQLRSRLQAIASGEDANLIRLSATHPDPELAALVANTWADIFIERANRLYGTQSADMLSFYQSQKDAAAADVEAAEQALVDYQARNQFVSLDNQLLAILQLQTDYLTNQHNIRTTQLSIRSLMDILNGSDDPNVTYTDQLTLLSLQLKAFNLVGYVPFLMTNEAGGPLTVENRRAQLESLDRLNEALSELDSRIEEDVRALQPQILEIQRQREAADRQYRQLVRERDVAAETFVTLARRFDEERVTSQDTTVGVGLASSAATPLEPSGSALQRNTLAGALGGLLVGTLMAFILDWRRRTNRQTAMAGRQETGHAAG